MDNDSLDLNNDSAHVQRQLAALHVSAMNILAIREHSIAELRVKLRTKLRRQLERKQKSSYDEEFDELIEIVLQQLISDDLLNEIRFTESFIRFRISKGSGPVKIRHELNERGISRELINNALETSYDFWQQHIELVYSKRFGDKKPANYKEQSKQSRFLYQRGFSGELIHCFFN